MSRPLPSLVAPRPAVRQVAVPGPATKDLHRPLATYVLLLGATLLLLALGLVMVLSASSVQAYADSGSTLAVARKQLMWAAVGVPLMLAVAFVPVRWFRAAALPLLLVSMALLVLVLVPGIGVSVNGNQNWIDFGGPFRLQPSEAAKLALAIWGADLLVRKARLLDQWRHLLVPLLPVAGLILLLVLAGGDLGTAIVLTAVVAALLYFAGAPLRLFALLGGLAAAGVAALVVTAPYRLDRFRSWLDPGSDPLGVGFQALHGRYALGSGGWFGLGLGASREKWGGLPEAHTDFIYAVIGEELGLLGTLTVLVLFAVIVLAGIRIALHATDPFVRLASAALTTWVAVQAAVNIGAVLGLLPITGIPLPLVSYGGSALLPLLMAVGMLLAFARQEPAAAAALAARRERRGVARRSRSTRPGTRPGPRPGNRAR